MSADIVKQTQFDFDRFRLIEDVPIPDRLKPGDSAVDVFCEIMRLNPKIRDFSIKFYNPEDESSDDTTTEDIDNEEDGGSKSSQAQIWLPRRCANKDILKDISDVNFRESCGKNILAVCSEVALENGETMYIPMMDFVVEDTEDSRLLVGDMFRSSSGALLFSGNSFHFWGTKLMPWIKWYDTVEKYFNSESVRKRNSIEPIFDANYLKRSMIRENAALRIFGYIGTEHEEVEPRTIMVIK